MFSTSILHTVIIGAIFGNTGNKVELGAGPGDFAGRVWRIGLMGESSDANHVNMFLSVLNEIVK